MIAADGGGSNGYRTRLWKTELATFAAETGITVTVPSSPGHQQVEQDRAPALLPDLDQLARPTADQHEVIVNTIGATTTASGAPVTAVLDNGEYPAGIKITAQQMRKRHARGCLLPPGLSNSSAAPARFERATPALGERCSIP